MNLARRITYDTDDVPGLGHYLVSIGKKRTGMVYQICGVREVQRRNPFNFPGKRYALKVLRCEDLVPHVRVSNGYLIVDTLSAHVTVLPLYWKPRLKRKSA